MTGAAGLGENWIWKPEWQEKSFKNPPVEDYFTVFCSPAGLSKCTERRRNRELKFVVTFMGIFDVPATELIEAVAAELKKSPVFKEPVWTLFVKSGRHRERQPQRRDWWQMRCASILFRVFKDGPVGTESLRTYYGGKRNRGVKPHHFSKASGKVIRSCLQALEKDGLIKKAKPKGRQIAPKGEKFLNAKAKEAFAIWQDKVKRADEIKAEKKRRREQKAAVKSVQTGFMKMERRERKGEEKKPGQKEKKEKPEK